VWLGGRGGGKTTRWPRRGEATPKSVAYIKAIMLDYTNLHK
jgi:hypothetical protein